VRGKNYLWEQYFTFLRDALPYNVNCNYRLADIYSQHAADVLKELKSRGYYDEREYLHGSIQIAKIYMSAYQQIQNWNSAEIWARHADECQRKLDRLR
jgi:hypothetical protein